MSPFLTTLGGGSARGFGRGRRITAVLGPTSAPTSLTATTVSTTQITLNWTNGDAGAQTQIYRGGVLVTTIAIGVTTYSDTGLQPTTLYDYYIKHIKNSITSANSSTVNGYTKPNPPTGFYTTVVSQTQITLSWSNTYSMQTRIYRGGVLITTVSAGVSTYSDTGLSAETTYSYNIAHFNNNAESTYQNASGTTLSPGAYISSLTWDAPYGYPPTMQDVYLTNLPASNLGYNYVQFFGSDNVSGPYTTSNTYLYYNTSTTATAYINKTGFTAQAGHSIRARAYKSSTNTYDPYGPNYFFSVPCPSAGQITPGINESCNGCDYYVNTTDGNCGSTGPTNFGFSEMCCSATDYLYGTFDGSYVTVYAGVSTNVASLANIEIYSVIYSLCGFGGGQVFGNTSSGQSGRTGTAVSQYLSPYNWDGSGPFSICSVTVNGYVNYYTNSGAYRQKYFESYVQ